MGNDEEKQKARRARWFKKAGVADITEFYQKYPDRDSFFKQFPEESYEARYAPGGLDSPNPTVEPIVESENVSTTATINNSSAASGAPTPSAEAGVNTSVLNNIKGSYEPVLNKDNFQLSDISPEQQAEFDKMSYMERNPATGPLSLTDYYPDVNNPVGVGSYSGSMIGSTTLFAPGGGLVPLGMMDARDKAIQDAAYSKAKEYDAFRKMYQAPTTKLVNIQPEISKGYNEMLQGYIGEAKKKYGKNAFKVLESDPNFLAKNKSFQDLAKYGDSIVDAKAKLDDAKKTGKYTVTPSLLATEKKLMSATNPDSPEFKKLGDYYRSFNMDLDFNDVFNETVKQIAMQQDATAGADTSDPEYIRTFDSTKKYYNEASIAAAVESMKAQFPQSDYFTDEYIEKNVRARMSVVQEDKKAGATQKRDQNDGSGFKYDINNDFSDEPTSITATVQQKAKAGGGTYQSDVTGTDGVTFKKPIPIVMPIGKDTYFTDEGLVPSQNLGNKSVLLGDMVIVDVIDNKGQWNDGVPLTKEQIKSGEYKNTRKASMVLGKYKDTGADGVESERSFFVPTKKVENSLVKKWTKDKKVEQGVPVDESYRRVERYNSKNKGSKATKPSAPSKKSIKKSDVQAKASAAGYTVDEYTKLLKQNGVNIID